MEFNSLPAEVYLKIFSYLLARDVLKIRRVCKLWRQIINSELKFKELLCFRLREPKRVNPKSKSKWDFYFSSSMKSFLDNVNNEMKFAKIKFLSANLFVYYDELEYAFGFLNTFKFLEKAEFLCRLSYYDHLNNNRLIVANPPEAERRQFVVNLDRLKNFIFDFSQITRHPKASVVLNLPSLLYLSAPYLEDVTITYPEKLEALATISLFKGVDSSSYSKFHSLSKIYTASNDLQSISASFIERLPSLSELHLDTYYPYNHSQMCQPSVYDKTRPKIFYFGFEITIRQINLEGDRIPNLTRFVANEDATRFIIQNLHNSVDNNQSIGSICYNEMASELDDTEMFAVFPRKFPWISYLLVKGNVVDENRLLKFICKSKIQTLYFEETSLSRTFFEKLPENGPFIGKLMIGRTPTMDILSGDFDFVLNMKSLYGLHFSDSPLPLNYLANVFKVRKTLNVEFGQPEEYNFSLFHYTKSLKKIDLRAPDYTRLGLLVTNEEAAEFMNECSTRLKANGFVCPKQLLVLLRHMELELHNHLFMMKMYVYEQRHSIFLPKELLNFFH